MQFYEIGKCIWKRRGIRSYFLFLSAFALAHSALAQTITLSLKEESIEKAFSSIEGQTKYRFVYGKETVSKANPVTLALNHVSLEEALSKVFAGQPLTYSVEDQYVMVMAGKENRPPAIDVTGEVMDENGKPLQGVTVTDKRSEKSSVTDYKGEFILKDIDEHAMLIFSFVGRQTVELPVAGKPHLSVTLSMVSKTLDETIIQAYGTTTRRLNTGNIVKVSGDEIQNQPVTNPLAALQGRVPGMVITQTSGVPGSAFKVEIRGRTSLDMTISKNDPLFVIDGVPFAAGNNNLNQLTAAANNPRSITEGGLSPLNFINPQDIESIEILKDADATAIYGSRGANGVIIITTRKGETGKTKFDFNIYSGLSVVTRTMPMMNTKDYLQIRREAFANDGLTPSAIPGQTSYAPDLLVWDTTRFTDWRKFLTGGSARTLDAQASVSGGNSGTRFLLGGGYHHETTVFPGNLGLSRSSFHLSLDHTSPDKKFNASIESYLSLGEDNLNVRDMSFYNSLPPNFPSLYEPDGSLKFKEAGVAFSSLNLDNPLSYLFRKYSSNNESMNGNIQLSYKILKSLVARANLGYNSIRLDETSITPKTSIDPFSATLPSSNFGSSNARRWLTEPQIEYSGYAGKGKLSVLVGGTWQVQKNYADKINATGYTSDLLLYSLNAASAVTATNQSSQYNYASLFGRLNYDLSGKYIVNLTARRDGSSRFGPDRKFGNFGAAGVAWIISKEQFFSSLLSFINFAKIRASYGTTGNDQIGNYIYLDTWSPSTFPYQGIAALTETRLYNPDYSWEVNRKMEAALELTFLNSRISFSTAFYRNRSGNQLVSYKLPVQTGFNSITKNLPALVQNSGWEFVLNSTTINTTNIKWSTAFNVSIPKNKLLSFPALSSSSYSSFYVIGQPLALIYKYQFLGVDPTTGIYAFNDVNKDGVLNAADRMVLGNLSPKFYGGLENSFSYKNIQLDFLFEFKKQIGRNYYADQFSAIPGFLNNEPQIVSKHWQKPGDQSNIMKLISKPGGAAYLAIVGSLLNSNGIYSDASYIRLKTLSLSFAPPSKWVNRLHLENIKIYVGGQNLFTITHYLGADPETQSIYILPPLRTLAAGIRFTL
jgi:TonB-dependent starch-binding outer membrane protein SusC